MDGGRYADGQPVTEGDVSEKTGGDGRDEKVFDRGMERDATITHRLK